ncbi:hypothetical protein DID88_001983 [Monilinia fructigena]|uniref:Uncharacterized protein n=1 Tax=Monilinia fructigena TaxID=38457 RepID=A0A395IXN4_9HELO|nr:hypothetical protein DID88_001983 [Monilinia fructigena]
MPSTKRALAQANTNVILPPQKQNKEKCVPSNNDYESKTKEDQLAREAPTACPSTAGVISTSDSIYAQKDNSADYETLDSSVLNNLASARALSMQGDREAVIKRLRADDEKPSSKSKDKAFMHDAIKKLMTSLKKQK